MSGPLDGIRVLDLGRFIAGPFCGMLLADLGAEVIRVERTSGGEDRGIGLLTSSGDNFGFVNHARNKKAITLNFEKNEQARVILRELVKHADVVIESFSAQAAKAFGVTYEDLRQVRPDLIFANITAFGSTGPYRNRIGFDQVAKAMSGAMAISGFPGPPIREQVSHVDYMTGCLTALGVVSALYHRRLTGEGQEVETALLQTAVTLMAPYIGEWETGGKRRVQVGNRIYWHGPADLYQAKDGRWVMLSLVSNSIWHRFCRHIGRQDLVADPRFPNDLARWQHRDILDPIVAAWVASKPAAEIIAEGETIPIPCGLCYEQDEVAADPQVRERQMLAEVPTPDGNGTVLVTDVPLHMSATDLAIRRTYPAVGEHNGEIYGSLLGYGRQKLEQLRVTGVI